jgi:hypothetical protein
MRGISKRRHLQANVRYGLSLQKKVFNAAEKLLSQEHN